MHTHANTKHTHQPDHDTRRLALYYGQGERKTHVVAAAGDDVAICGRGVYRGPWDFTMGLPSYMRSPVGGAGHPTYCKNCVILAQQGVGA